MPDAPPLPSAAEAATAGDSGAGVRAIVQLAGCQHGVVARRQLAAAGLGRSVLETLIRRGLLLRLHRGVYAVGHSRLRREGRWLAAVLAAGPGAVLSHRDAAALHGVRPANGAGIDVTTTARARRIPGVRIHRARRLDDCDVVVAGGIPVTSLARTLVDLAGCVPPDHLARAIVRADQQRTIDVAAVRAAAARTAGRRGPGQHRLETVLAEHAALGTAATRSELERRFLRVVRDAGLPPPLVNAWLADHGVEVDVLWPEQRLVVELDGWTYHHARHAFQHDRTKSTALTIAGYRVLRYTGHDVIRRPDVVANGLRAILAGGPPCTAPGPRTP